jgi:outer membrane protein
MKIATLYSLAAVAAMSLAPVTASAQDLKIGYVSLDRVLRDAAPAKAAQAKLEAEFAKREKEIADLGAKVKAAADKFEKDALTMSESDRQRRQREVYDLDREVQRKRREYQEELNQRKNEEVQVVLDRANRVIKQIYETEKFDLILQDAVFVSARVDITDRVVKALSQPAAGTGK